MNKEKKYKDPNQVRTIMAEPIKEDIIKEFDKMISHHLFVCADYSISSEKIDNEILLTTGKRIKDDIRDFIDKLLASQKKEILEKIELMKKEQKKEFSPEEWIGYCYAVEDIKKLTQ